MSVIWKFIWWYSEHAVSSSIIVIVVLAGMVVIGFVVQYVDLIWYSAKQQWSSAN